METPSKGTWEQFNLLVIDSLQRLDKQHKEMDNKLDDKFDKLNEKLSRLSTKVTVLETKATLLGSLGGVLVFAIIELIKHFATR